jgi:hypothetical protein
VYVYVCVRGRVSVLVRIIAGELMCSVVWYDIISLSQKKKTEGFGAEFSFINWT